MGELQWKYVLRSFASSIRALIFVRLKRKNYFRENKRNTRAPRQTRAIRESRLLFIHLLLRRRKEQTEINKSATLVNWSESIWPRSSSGLRDSTEKACWHSLVRGKSQRTIKRNRIITEERRREGYRVHTQRNKKQKMAVILCIGNLLMLSGMSFAVYRANVATTTTTIAAPAPATVSATINIVASTAIDVATEVFPNETDAITEWNTFGGVSTSVSSNAITTTEYFTVAHVDDQSTWGRFGQNGANDDANGENSIRDNNLPSSASFRRRTASAMPSMAHTNDHRHENARIDQSGTIATVAAPPMAAAIDSTTVADKLTSDTVANVNDRAELKFFELVSSVSPSTSFAPPINVSPKNKRFRPNDFNETNRSTWPTNSTLIAAATPMATNGSIANVSAAISLPTQRMPDAPVEMPLKVERSKDVDRPVELSPLTMQTTAMTPNHLPARASTMATMTTTDPLRPLPFILQAMRTNYNNILSDANAITSSSTTVQPDTSTTSSDGITFYVPTSSDYTDDDANLSTQYVYYGNSNEAVAANDFDDYYSTTNGTKSMLVLPRNNNNNNYYSDVDDINNLIATDIAVVELRSSPIVISDTSASGGGNGGDSTIHWPVKKEAIMEGNLILGGLMMVHSREDTITCGPIMPQGGIQALEVMLFTLDRINEIGFLPNISLGAHILDDCDKDTYGLEMAVDFIKGKSHSYIHMHAPRSHSDCVIVLYHHNSIISIFMSN